MHTHSNTHTHTHIGKGHREDTQTDRHRGDRRGTVTHVHSHAVTFQSVGGYLLWAQGVVARSLKQPGWSGGRGWQSGSSPATPTQPPSSLRGPSAFLKQPALP